MGYTHKGNFRLEENVIRDRDGGNQVSQNEIRKERRKGGNVEKKRKEEKKDGKQEKRKEKWG